MSVEIEFRTTRDFKKLSFYHFLNQQSKNSSNKISTNRHRFDADMLSINNISRVYSADIFINKRKHESTRKLRVVIKTTNKKLKIVKKKKKKEQKVIKQRSNRAARIIQNASQYKSNEFVFNNDDDATTFSLFKSSISNFSSNVINDIEISKIFQTKKRIRKRSKTSRNELRVEIKSDRQIATRLETMNSSSSKIVMIEFLFLLDRSKIFDFSRSEFFTQQFKRNIDENDIAENNDIFLLIQHLLCFMLNSDRLEF